MLIAKVVNVEIDHPKGRIRTIIEADYTIKPGQVKRTKLGIRDVVSITQDEVASVAHNSELESANVHGFCWEPGMALMPIQGHDPRKLWSFVSHAGETFIESTAPTLRTPLDCFLDSFPLSHLPRIVDLTNAKLSKYDLEHTTREEILQYFGVLILCFRFEFGDRYDLWNSKHSSEFIPAANFGRTVNDLLICVGLYHLFSLTDPKAHHPLLKDGDLSTTSLLLLILIDRSRLHLQKLYALMNPCQNGMVLLGAG